MRWSKVRKLVEDSFADSVKGRVTVHMTQTSRGTPWACACGHGWLRIDKRVAVLFDTHESFDRFGSAYHETTNTTWERHRATHDAERMPGHLSEPGEFSRFDLAEACWTYLHSNAHASLQSANPIIRSLASLNARIGRRKLIEFAAAETHPLPKALAEFRLKAERAARHAVPA